MTAIKIINKIIVAIIVTSFVNLATAKTSRNLDEKFQPQHLDNKSLDNNSYANALTPNFVNRDWINEIRQYHSCPGYYKEIPIPAVTIPEISADSSELSQHGVSILNGNVVYLDQNQKISAERALIERDANLKKFSKLKVTGNIEYLTPELRIVSKELEADLLENKAYINTPTYFRYYPRNIRGNAEKTVLIKDTNYQLYNSEFTTCPPANSDWLISANEINIDPNRQIGTAKNTILYFYDIPIFYSPYLRFPTSNQRESGLLMPLYSQSDRYGVSVSTPYYFNLAPNYDLTIAPRYMTKRNSQLLVETRHMNKYGYNTTNLEYLPNDNEFAKFRKDTLANPPLELAPNNPRLTNLKDAKTQRYAFKVNDDRKWTNYLSTSVNYSYLSDNQYYLDLPRSNVMRQQTADHILQQGKANFNYNNWRVEALTKGYQTLHTIEGPDLTEPYRILPAVSIKNDYILLSNLSNLDSSISLIGSIDSNLSRFASPSNPKASKLAEGQRYYIKPAISLPLKKSYGYFTPKIAADIRFYDLKRLSPSAQMLDYAKQQNYFIPIFSLDSGLYFDKEFELKHTHLNHTIEPRLFYLKVPKKNQNQAPDFDIKQSTISYDQFFRDNSFSGYDRQSSANQITAGIASRLQNAANGQEYLRLQIGQTFYFEDRDTSICDNDYNRGCIKFERPDYQHRYSPFITQLNLNFTHKIYGQTEWQWDHYLNKTKKINVGLHYIDNQPLTKAAQTIFNIEYNFLKEGNIQNNINGTRIYKLSNKRNDLSEIETSVKLPIYYNLVGLGFYSYDIRNKANLDQYFGLELQKCCWALRVGYRSQLRLRTNSLADKNYDNIFTMQFSLKGLGELNQGFESVLQNNIPGYQNQLDQIY